MRRRRTSDAFLFIPALFIVSAAVVFYTVLPRLAPVRYTASPPTATAHELSRVVHLATPIPVRGIYMTQCVASDKSLREKLVALIDQTELNTVVIDIKDYSGRISFYSSNPVLSSSVSRTCSAADMGAFIGALHQSGIYVVGRITVFQDSVMAARRPDLAVKLDTDRTKNWSDRKGINYLDPGAKDVWDYIVVLSREAYALGFDEINFDYIRFPSDGDMGNIYFPFSEAVINADPKGGKASVLSGFFAYLNQALKKDNIPISADLFGMTTTNTDDLNIGQVLEDALSNFDYVSPMVYPSHYPGGFLGFSNPAEKPYEVVRYSMDSAVQRASTTPWKLRPWLQDFNLGAVYTPEMVKTQIQAVYDSGLSSWLLWNASNRYTREALLEK